MKIKQSLFLIIFFFANMSFLLAGNHLRGVVTSDGRGLKDVVVTDGFTCVTTNEKGEYTLAKHSDSKYVYISTPSGYLTEKKDKTIPQFYQVLESGKSEYNFDLKKNKKDDSKHVLFAQADVQVTSEKNLKQYEPILNDMISHAASYPDYDVFSVNCGDIVGDTPSLFPSYIKTSSVLDMPVYRVKGNHDMDFGGRSHETSSKTIESYFGPTRYSFNKGNAHYVVLDNTYYIGRGFYYVGYIDEKTFAWLEQDLQYVEAGTPVFVFMHIPGRLTKEEEPFKYEYSPISCETMNISSLHKMLAPYNAHYISGHMHYNHNVVFNDNAMEHVTGAICGTWWLGDICLDGTPQGYGVYVVEGKDVKWYYKSSGFSKDYQLRAYKPGASKEYPNELIANVWDWDETWKVEWLENGVVMGEMIHFTGYDPQAEILCSDKEKIIYDWISPQKTEHLFRATPKNVQSKLSVRATNRFGEVFQEDLN